VTAMLWVKVVHVFFVIGWFAGLFYLPRILVNIALAPAQGPERDRLLVMARKLRRFSHMLGGTAILFGLGLWLGFGVGAGERWLHAKLAIVVLLLIFEYVCKREIVRLQAGGAPRSHVWYRWFNEIPTVLLFPVLVLVIGKPI
jgi:putative membrane protein